jgi:hypothetical protein
MRACAPFPIAIAIAVTAGLVRVGDSVRGWFLRAGHHGSLTYAVNTKAFYPDLNTAVLAGDPPHGSRGLVGGLPRRAAVSASLLRWKTQYECKFDSRLRNILAGSKTHKKPGRGAKRGASEQRYQATAGDMQRLKLLVEPHPAPSRDDKDLYGMQEARGSNP